MAGHNKWANIKNRKGAMDAKRSKAFTQVSKLIKAAVKEGGSGDPAFNPQLRTMIEKAREVNMPKEKIQKAIDRGLGKTAAGVTIQEIVYEGFGPNGVGMIIVATTDNTQRTSANIRSALAKAGGSLAGPGAAMYLFQRSADGSEYVPTMPMEITDQSAVDKLISLTDILREDDDVEDVFMAAVWQSEDDEN